MIILSPSILSADFMNLESEINLLKEEGVKYLHVDVMDGIFVPNISIGMPVIASIRRKTDMILDVHLMVHKPERYIDEFIKVGCDIINFHIEATDKHNEIIQKVKSANRKVGITMKPNTDYKEILPFIDELDLILIMGVEPGFGGQKLIKNSLNSVKNLRKYIDDNNLDCMLEIDGGVKLDNIDEVLQSGADTIVVGSDIFSADDKRKVISTYNDIFSKIYK